MFSTDILYRPSSMVIGFGTNSPYVDSVPYGIVSCKWLGRNKWTSLSNFDRMTGGFKPYVQRNSEKQIQKDLGMKIKEVSNDFIDGFCIVDIQYSFSSSTYIVYVKDPRGFVVGMPLSWLNTILFKHHCSIISKLIEDNSNSSMMLEGKWAYAWYDDNTFRLIDEKHKDKITVDDDSLAAKTSNVKRLKPSDLVPGTVYDVFKKNNDSTTRFLYIGKFNIPSPHRMIDAICDFENMFCHHYRIYGYNYRSGKTDKMRISAKEPEIQPWDLSNSQNTKSLLATLDNIFKNTKPVHAFVDLNKESYSKWGYVGKFMQEIGNDIKFSMSVTNGSVVYWNEVMHRIFKASNIQSLPGFAFDDAKNGFQTNIDDILGILKEIERLCVLERPNDFNAWCTDFDALIEKLILS